MKSIRIISDSYSKNIKFEIYDTVENDGWVNIAFTENRNSKLLSKEYSEKFFSFKAGDIITEIVNEYGRGDKELKIVFKGTLDHFQELKQLIEINDYQTNIILNQDENYLLNAEDVLIKIIKVFKKLMSIIDVSTFNKEEIIENLSKFSESSAEVIPLCIIGNVSSGKSTFINSLIGKEILPSGDNPVTAKVFKIVQLDEGQTSFINFKYGDVDIVIEFINKDVVISTNCPLNLREGILESVNEIQSVEPMISSVLMYLNNLKDKELSSIIEISTDFIGGIWNQYNKKFIIIDTPGSNSVSNLDHSEVLDKALNGLTNGLPVFVTKPSDLDSDDNLELYQKIESMNEIDSRFTLIIANQADNADLPEEGYFDKTKEQHILSQSAPKNMYAAGIYYTSAIMGLGSKKEGSFINKSYQRVFKKNTYLFDGQDEEDFLKLYNYNIMPSQIKRMNTQVCETKTDDPIYVNSGMFSVEMAIQNFANKYSAYNKCQQSVKYLKRVAELVTEELNKLKEEREIKKNELNEELDDEKTNLITLLDNSARDYQDTCIVDGIRYLREYTEQNNAFISKEELKEHEDKFIERQREIINYDKYVEEFENAKKKISKDYETLTSVFNTPLSDTFEKLKNMNLFGDVKQVISASNTEKEKRIKVNESAGDETIKLLEDMFSESVDKFFNILNAESQNTWNMKADLIRRLLVNIVVDSVLDNNKKKELSDIIINYENLTYNISEKDKPKFDIKRHRRPFSEGKLDIEKLEKTVNEECKKFAHDSFEIIKDSHIKDLETWLNKLLSKLKTNIVDYNSKLSILQDSINAEEAQIYDYNNKLDTIKRSIDYINSLMIWQN